MAFDPFKYAAGKPTAPPTANIEEGTPVEEGGFNPFKFVKEGDKKDEQKQKEIEFVEGVRAMGRAAIIDLGSDSQEDKERDALQRDPLPGRRGVREEDTVSIARPGRQNIQPTNIPETEESLADPQGPADPPGATQAFIESAVDTGTLGHLPDIQSVAPDIFPDPTADVDEELRSADPPFEISELPEQTTTEKRDESIARHQRQAETNPLATGTGVGTGALIQGTLVNKAFSAFFKGVKGALGIDKAKKAFTPAEKLFSSEPVKEAVKTATTRTGKALAIAAPIAKRTAEQAAISGAEGFAAAPPATKGVPTEFNLESRKEQAKQAAKFGAGLQGIIEGVPIVGDVAGKIAKKVKSTANQLSFKTMGMTPAALRKIQKNRKGRISPEGVSEDLGQFIHEENLTQGVSSPDKFYTKVTNLKDKIGRELKKSYEKITDQVNKIESNIETLRPRLQKRYRETKIDSKSVRNRLRNDAKADQLDGGIANRTPNKDKIVDDLMDEVVDPLFQKKRTVDVLDANGKPVFESKLVDGKVRKVKKTEVITEPGSLTGDNPTIFELWEVRKTLDEQVHWADPLSTSKSRAAAHMRGTITKMIEDKILFLESALGKEAAGALQEIRKLNSRYSKILDINSVALGSASKEAVKDYFKITPAAATKGVAVVAGGAALGANFPQIVASWLALQAGQKLGPKATRQGLRALGAAMEIPANFLRWGNVFEEIGKLTDPKAIATALTAIKTQDPAFKAMVDEALSKNKSKERK